jgi:hypothetical protein
MSFFKSLFSKKTTAINSYADFWEWFSEHKDKFHSVVKEQGDIDTVFFKQLAPKLEQLKDGIWFLVGMSDEETVELILTADGNIKNIVFVEELVAAAPSILNWKITALKQPLDSNQYGIEMQGYVFDGKTMQFYAENHNDMPDEIDIVITHQDLTEENRDIITSGVYIAIDHTLGELNSVTTIDNLNILHPSEASQELIPIEKLRDFLIWRSKEFIEKYEGVRHDTENDAYSPLEGTTHNDLPMIAIVNLDLLNWDRKASHPWIVVLNLKYNGSNNNGLPNQKDYERLHEIEEEILLELKDAEGYLNVGRQTADSNREVYFACVDFRIPSKVMYKIQGLYGNEFEITYDIYKDKYWQTFERFL